MKHLLLILRSTWWCGLLAVSGCKPVPLNASQIAYADFDYQGIRLKVAMGLEMRTEVLPNLYTVVTGTDLKVPSLKVQIDNSQLVVNGKAHGQLKPGDRVTVNTDASVSIDHGATPAH